MTLKNIDSSKPHKIAFLDLKLLALSFIEVGSIGGVAGTI
jgi:hypothetical protein